MADLGGAGYASLEGIVVVLVWRMTIRASSAFQAMALGGGALGGLWRGSRRRARRGRAAPSCRPRRFSTLWRRSAAVGGHLGGWVGVTSFRFASNPRVPQIEPVPSVWRSIPAARAASARLIPSSAFAIASIRCAVRRRGSLLAKRRNSDAVATSSRIGNARPMLPLQTDSPALCVD